MVKSPLPSPKLTETDLNSRFKSILKKPSTFGDSDSSSNVDRTPSPSRKTGSQKNCQFYLPTPLPTPRKKVQFLMLKDQQEKEVKISTNEDLECADTSEDYEVPVQKLKLCEPPMKSKTSKVGTSPKISKKMESAAEATVFKSKMYFK